METGNSDSSVSVKRSIHILDAEDGISRSFARDSFFCYDIRIDL